LKTLRKYATLNIICNNIRPLNVAAFRFFVFPVASWLPKIKGVFQLSDRVKNLLLTALKLTLAFGMVLWMVRSGKLDMASLKVFVDHPWALFGCFAYWLFFGLCCGSTRWFLLLRGLGIKVPYFQAIRLTLIGLFFNSAMPGAVGGDVVKAIYISKSAHRGQKGATLVSIVLDRVVGLYGLFSFAAFISILAWNGLSQNPILSQMAQIVLFLFGSITLVFAHILFHPKQFDIVDKALSFPFLHKFRGLYHSLLRFREAKSCLLLAWLISICIQGASILLFWKIAELLTEQNIGFVKFCTAAPLAILATAIPLAPGGLGVGHVAFERILGLVGVNGGANIFNVVFLTSLVFNLSGIIPYMLQPKVKLDSSSPAGL
jgi:uncharacterized protein (TIRG00374 family)